MPAETLDEDGDGAAAASPGLHVSALLRRIRRTADLSQRELAGALDVSRSTVARAETGQRDLPATVLARAAELAGLRLGLLDADGAEVTGMSPDAVRDRAGRHFPAHLDVRRGDVDWWHGDERYSRERPRYTFDRDRSYRDRFRTRASSGPTDHLLPRPGDSLAVWAQVRKDVARLAEAERRAELAARQRRLGISSLATDPVCSCPDTCDELLFAEEPLSRRQQALPHADACACRCDIA
jgi:transcriptional regulator with XRE-family HTH domain